MPEIRSRLKKKKQFPFKFCIFPYLPSSDPHLPADEYKWPFGIPLHPSKCSRLQLSYPGERKVAGLENKNALYRSLFILLSAGPVREEAFYINIFMSGSREPQLVSACFSEQEAGPTLNLP